MLVLKREVGEVIMIGNDIQIKIVRIDRGKVRIGITAPDSVKVNRKEIQDEIDAGITKKDKEG